MSCVTVCRYALRKRSAFGKSQIKESCKQDEFVCHFYLLIARRFASYIVCRIFCAPSSVHPEGSDDTPASPHL